MGLCWLGNSGETCSVSLVHLVSKITFRVGSSPLPASCRVQPVLQERGAGDLIDGRTKSEQIALNSQLGASLFTSFDVAVFPRGEGW